jgi:hypothetical protein
VRGFRPLARLFSLVTVGMVGAPRAAHADGDAVRPTPAEGSKPVDAAVVPAAAVPGGGALAAQPAPVAPPAATSSAPTTQKRSGYSAYERDRLHTALTQLELERELHPEGQLVESIELFRLEVIDKADPAPDFLNAVHVLTQEHVLAREVLLKVGENFSDSLADETARNLRRFSQLSLVLCVAVKGSAPGKVRVLVVTKDTWSLRLSYDFQANAGGIDSLTISPQEANLGGLLHTAAVRGALTPANYGFGATYRVPRFGNSYIGGSASADVFFGRKRGELEGYTTGLSITRPLYTTRSALGWSVSGSVADQMSRRFSNGKLVLFGERAVPREQRVPFEYGREAQVFNASLTRSYGWAHKFDITAGLTFDRKRFVAPDLSDKDPATVERFLTTRVPRSDTRVGPYVQLRAYTTNYHRITDFDSLGLQEDYRIGYDFYLSVYPVTQALGSTRDFLGIFASAQYTLPLGDGMVRAGVESLTELQLDNVPDASLQATLRSVTPRLGFGRFVLDMGVTSRYRNYMRSIAVLGGESRLRGYPTSFFDGQSYAVMNLEFRSRPVRIFSVQLGAVAFFDAGDATNDLTKLRPKQSAGFGVRVVLPQFNRSAVRFDVGFPITRPLPAGVAPIGVFFGLEQAFAFGNAGPG